ncbi:hypothetical protein [Candidatus Manganitrophus noduliformans]|uniref:Uncharacterized protein n=1 Tax=Candidatus Manganitrophus noduliformans TaxID=2606439 RepID=A0A7X6ICF8_9BACT|nr:hypothetical protein [Candidatus Manganitrophus noduliformans]NKE72806.1 hypothetical protein [Candidatus Manganitrophus noduliformans]
MIKYLFRKPKYPILIETDFRVAGARNAQKIERLAGGSAFGKKESYTVIDATGEGWSFVPKYGVISPLTIDKRWNKLKIIEFFNASLARTGIVEKYEARSLSNKRMDRVVGEIVEFESKFLNRSGRRR